MIFHIVLNFRIKAVFRTMWSPDEGKVNKCLSWYLKYHCFVLLLYLKGFKCWVTEIECVRSLLVFSYCWQFSREVNISWRVEAPKMVYLDIDFIVNTGVSSLLLPNKFPINKKVSSTVKSLLNFETTKLTAEWGEAIICLLTESKI